MPPAPCRTSAGEQAAAADHGHRGFASQVVRHSAALVIFVLLLALPASAQPQFPRLSGRVVDAANILPPALEASLGAKLAALEARTGSQVVVATVPSLQGYEIADYGYQLGRAWGIGRQGSDNGAILLVAPNERRVRIEVGYGLEPVLTDAVATLIIHNRILPRFRAGDLPGGVAAGADAIVQQLDLPPEQARAQAAAAERQRTPDAAGPGIGAAIWFVVIFAWVAFAFARRSGGRRYRRRGFGAPIVIWGPGIGGWGGGFGSGGGSLGGGFSGGGGSFGGGGSTGSW